VRTLLRVLLAIGGVLIVLLGTAYWLTATQSGTRWLLGQVSARAPEQLVLGSAQGSLLRGIELDSLEWRSDSVEVHARGIAVDIELLPLLNRHLIVSAFGTRALEVQVFDVADDAPAEDVPLAVDLPVDITIHEATITDIRFASGTLRREIAGISLASELRGSQLQVKRLALRSDWVDLDLSGNVVLTDTVPFDTEARWRWKDDELPALAGHLQATGNLNEMEIRHELREPLLVTSAGRVAREAGTVRLAIDNEWRQQQWVIPQGTISSSAGRLLVRGRVDDRLAIDLDARAGLDGRPEASLTASGDVRLQPQTEFDIAYRIDALDTAYLHETLSGSLASHGRLSGTLQDGAFELAVQAEELRGEINGYPLEGAATARIAPNVVLISEATARLGDNVARLQGRIGDPVAVDVTAEFADISQLAPQITGSVRGSVSVQGPAAQPQMRGDLRVETLATGGFALDSAEISVSGNSGEHTLEARVSAYDTALVAAASGALNQQGWSGAVTRLEIDNPLAGRWVASRPSVATVSPALSRLAEVCLERTEMSGTACFGGALKQDGSAAFDLAVTGLPVAALPVVLPDGVSVRGDVKARLTVARVNELLRADARLELVNTAFDAVYMDEQLTLALAEARAQASVVNNRLESSLRVALAEGAGNAAATLTIPELDAAEPLVAGGGEIEVGDAALFAFFVPGIARPQGRIEGEIEFAGSPAAPEFIGSIRVSDGAFGVRQTGITISDLMLELSQSRPGEMQLSGSARSGEGTLSVTGSTWFGQDLGIRSEVTLSGENFELARLPDWQVAASPSITAVFDDRATRVTGELAIPTARVKMREVPQAAAQASPDTVVHRQDSDEPVRRRRLDIDITASVGDDVQFTGFGLSAGLTGNLALRGGTHAPYTGQGKLSLVDGRYKAFGQELKIERGDLIFSGPLEEPLLDVLAVRQVQDVRAGIQLSGTPSRLRSELFSDPVMSDAEALSYLLTGRPLADSTSAGEGQGLDQAAFALGLSGAGLISAQIRTQLGLETLTIAGVGEESRLIAGKRLGDRLLVEYGYGLVDKLGTLLLRYQLNERIVLESRTGTVSNFDIVYRRRKK
jgi:translocation and assembly module TamB